MRSPISLVCSLLSLSALATAVAIDLNVSLGHSNVTKGLRVPPEVAQIITDKKLKYARFADTHQWDKFDQVALPECTYEYTDHGELIVDQGFEYSWGSTDEFTSFFSVAFDTLQTIHMTGPGEFTFNGKDCNTVLATFPVIYHSALARGVDTSQGITGMGGGHYYETYVRKGDDWFMSKCTMDRIYEQSE
jgi:hypothetical protein